MSADDHIAEPWQPARRRLSAVPPLSPAESEAETTRQEWERCLASMAAVREAFYDLAPPDVQAAFDVLARAEGPR